MTAVSARGFEEKWGACCIILGDNWGYHCGYHIGGLKGNTLLIKSSHFLGHHTSCIMHAYVTLLICAVHNAIHGRYAYLVHVNDDKLQLHSLGSSKSKKICNMD